MKGSKEGVYEDDRKSYQERVGITPVHEWLIIDLRVIVILIG